jgi:hypothetical protein
MASFTKATLQEHALGCVDDVRVGGRPSGAFCPVWGRLLHAPPSHSAVALFTARPTVTVRIGCSWMKVKA